MRAKTHHRKSDKDRLKQLQAPDPERLHDINHRMNNQTNEVQGEVSYDENTRQGNQDSHLKKATQWKNILSDYRRKYPAITDEDIHLETGGFDNMTGRIAKRTNRNREDVYNEVKDWNNTI